MHTCVLFQDCNVLYLLVHDTVMSTDRQNHLFAQAAHELHEMAKPFKINVELKHVLTDNCLLT